MAAAAAAVPAVGGGDGGGHPLEGRRWLRLALITTSCLVSSGLGPGIAVISQLLVEANVGRSLCSRTWPPCEEQYFFVSETLTTGTGVSLLLYLFVGWLFDRVGGRVLSQVGAAVLAVGYLLLQIPLYGAHHWSDDQTRGWLLVAVIFTETGSALATAAVMSIAWHFHDLQTLVAACVASTNSAAAILPTIMIAVMRASGHSLPTALWVWFCAVVLAGVCCRYTVPDLEEYRAQGERVLGTLPPTHKVPILQMFLDANAVLLPHWWVHLITIIALGAVQTTYLVYAGLLGDLGWMLFGSDTAGDELTSTLNTFTFFAGAVIAPLMSYVNDSISQGVIYMLLCLTALGILMSVFIAQTTWLAQVLTCICSSVLFAIMGAYCNRHCLAFAGPARVGIVYGLMQTYMSLVYFALSSLAYASMSSLPWADPTHITGPLQAGSIATASLLAALTACVLMVGLPQQPVALAEDTEGLPTAESPEPCKRSM